MLSLIAADLEATGRFDPSMLTELQRLEMFFTPVEGTHAWEALGGDADDPCTWVGLQCNKSNVVVQIRWVSSFFSISGSVDFSMLPSELTHIVIDGFPAITGEVNTKDLPLTLSDLYLHGCSFTGTLDMGNLPPKLENFTVRENKITAIRNFRNIPPSLRSIKIQEPNVTDERLVIGTLPPGRVKYRWVVLDGTPIRELILDNPSDFVQVSHAHSPDPNELRLVDILRSGLN